VGRRARRRRVPRRRGDRARAARRRRGRAAGRRHGDARGVRRRLRRRAQRDPHGGRDRLPGLGAVDQLHHRRGRHDRRARARPPDGRQGHARAGQAGERPDPARGARRAGRDRPADPRGPAPGADRGARDGLRPRRRHLAVAVQRHDPAGGRVPGGTRAGGRRCRARALPDRRTGPQPRRAGRRQPGMEAGAGRGRHVAGEPARHLPRRAASGCRARPANDDGADAADAGRRSDRGPQGADRRPARRASASPG